jgi:hypothetical protein
MWNLLILLACGGPTVSPADPQRLRDALGLGVIPRAPLAPIEGAATVVDGVRVIPVSLQLYAGLRVSAALWLPPGEGPFDAALVAHGHFGEGKTAGESQAPASLWPGRATRRWPWTPPRWRPMPKRVACPARPLVRPFTQPGRRPWRRRWPSDRFGRLPRIRGGGM